MKDKSSVFNILLHGFFLASTNLFSIMVIIGVVVMLDMGESQVVQRILLLLLNVIIYLLVYYLMRRNFNSSIMNIESWTMFMSVWMISLVILPIVFYPMYYLTMGNWSPFENLIIVWLFQVITNALCLVLNFFVIGKTS